MARKKLTELIAEVKILLRATGATVSEVVEVEISSGAITRTARYMSLTVEGGSGSGADTLTTINYGGCADGTRLTLRITYETANDYVTIAHGTDNLSLMEIAGIGRDFTENSIYDRLELEWDSTNSAWVELWRKSGVAA